MDGIKPSTMMMMGGGVVLFISTFLDWFSAGRFSQNGWETDAYGLLGIFVALAGLALVAGPALTTFGDIDLPDEILSFSRTQIYLVLAEFGFLINFGLLFGDAAIGTILGSIAAGVAWAGAFMDLREGTGGSTPPTQF